uniref:Uncharacterized protein n=1 Tax=Lepeophtheirus salmonis TaxID=72036 RepID=A0A0K2VE36_LEPSM
MSILNRLLLAKLVCIIYRQLHKRRARAFIRAIGVERERERSDPQK